jgi:hypothetical protein
MLAREPIPPPPPPPPAPPRAPKTDARTLHTSLQLPREARWSRSSAIALSVLVHVALFIAIRNLVWKKAPESDGPVFQVFKLTQPVEQPRIVVAPPIATPPKSEEKKDAVTAQENFVSPPAQQSPQLVEPTEVPSTIPPPTSTPIAEPSVTSAPPSSAPQTAAQRLLRTGTSLPSAFGAPKAGLPPMPTGQEIAAQRLANGIKAYNDSMAGAAAAASKSTDWTKTDKNGNKWGVSPGQIHLGGITIPLPFSFGVAPGRRDDYNKAMRSFAESNDQAKRLETDQTFESRVKEMRKRKDAQRDSARAATGH